MQRVQIFKPEIARGVRAGVAFVEVTKRKGKLISNKSVPDLVAERYTGEKDDVDALIIQTNLYMEAVENLAPVVKRGRKSKAEEEGGQDAD